VFGKLAEQNVVDVCVESVFGIGSMSSWLRSNLLGSTWGKL